MTTPSWKTAVAPAPAMARRHSAPERSGAQNRSAIANSIDLIVIFLLIVSNVRIFKGSSVASFTLIELFVWGYCAPYVVSYFVLKAKPLPAGSHTFVFTLWLYGLWLVVISILALVMRGDSEVLQNTKNILPGLILVPYLLIRFQDMRQVVVISNIYIVYAVLSALVGLLQFKYGAPYFKEFIEGVEWKQDLMGEIVSDPVVGFSAHPNEFAISVLPAVSWAAVKFWERLRYHYRVDVAALAVAIFISGTMVVAQAKGAAIFTMVALAFVVSPLGRCRSFLLKLMWLGVFITGVTIWGLREAASGAAPGAETVETRFLLWETAIRAMTTDWYIALFGNGHELMTQLSNFIADWEFPNSHNTWMDQIVQFGVPALLMYLSIWWAFFQTAEAPMPDRPPLNTMLLDGCRVTILALMGDYFFEPASVDVSDFAELLFIMTMAIRIASFTTAAGPPRLRPTIVGFTDGGPFIRRGIGLKV